VRIDWLIVSTRSIGLQAGSLRAAGLAVNRVALKDASTMLPFFGAFRVTIDAGESEPAQAHLIAFDPDRRVSGNLVMETKRTDPAAGIYDYMGHGLVKAETPGAYTFVPMVNGKVLDSAPRWTVRVDDERIMINGIPLKEPYPVAIRMLITHVIRERQHLTMTEKERAGFLQRYGNYMADEERRLFQDGK
jgi:hypothetical protein